MAWTDFSPNKLNYHLKSAIWLHLGYLCLTVKCEDLKYMLNKKEKQKTTVRKNVFLHGTVDILIYIYNVCMNMCRSCRCEKDL